MKLNPLLTTSISLIIRTVIAYTSPQNTNKIVSQNLVANISTLWENKGDTNYQLNGDLTVNNNVYFFLTSYNFYVNGNFLNNGTFYIANGMAWPNYYKGAGGQTMDINYWFTPSGTNVGTFYNYGTFIVNDNCTSGGPSYYWFGNKFYNKGTIIMGGAQLKDGATMQIQPKGTGSFLINEGIIQYTQYQLAKNPPSTYYGSRANCDTSVPTSINNGTICLWHNNALFQANAYAGNGCIVVDELSTLSLQCAQSWDSDGINQQTVYLASNTSVLDFYTTGSNYVNPKPIVLRGWGNNNTILFNSDGTGYPPTWVYDGTLLNIQVHAVGKWITYVFDIGPDYDTTIINRLWNSNSQYTGTPFAGNDQTTWNNRWAFYYNAPVPNSRPLVCQTCPGPLQYPNVNAILDPKTTYTTTYTSTASFGSIETNSGVVIVTTDTVGSYTTKTSLYPPPPYTTYTTTYTSTLTDGSVKTRSGVAVVTTDTAGSYTTMTSFYSPPPYTTFTSTFASTLTDGYVETHSGIVVVTTNSVQQLTTTTSMFTSPTYPSTTYTSTFETTLTDGFVETYSGIVVISTNSIREPITTISMFPTPTYPLTTYTTTFTSVYLDGVIHTKSAIVIISTNSIREITTSTSFLLDDNFITPTAVESNIEDKSSIHEVLDTVSTATIGSDLPMISSEYSLISSLSIIPYESSTHNSETSDIESIGSVARSEFDLVDPESALITSISIDPYQSLSSAEFSIRESDETEKSSDLPFIGSTLSIPYMSSTYSSLISIIESDESMVSSEHDFVSSKYPYQNSSSWSPYASSTYNSVLSSYKSIESDINSEDKFLSSESAFISFSTINPYHSSTYSIEIRESYNSVASSQPRSSVPLATSTYSTIFSITESHESSDYAFVSSNYPYLNYSSSDPYLSSISSFSVIKSNDRIISSESPLVSPTASIHYVSSSYNMEYDEPSSNSGSIFISSTSSIDYESSTYSTIFSVIEPDDSVVASEDYFINAEPSVTSSTFSTSYESSAYISLSSTIGPDDSIVSSESSLASFTSSIANDSSSHNTIFSIIESDGSQETSEYPSSASINSHTSSTHSTEISVIESDESVPSSESSISTRSSLPYESSTYSSIPSITESHESEVTSDYTFVSPKYPYLNHSSSDAYFSSTHCSLTSVAESDDSVITLESSYIDSSLYIPVESSVYNTVSSSMESDETEIISRFLFISSSTSIPYWSSTYNSLSPISESVKSIIAFENDFINSASVSISCTFSTSDESSTFNESYSNTEPDETEKSSDLPFIGSTLSIPYMSSTYSSLISIIESDESMVSSEHDLVSSKYPYQNSSSWSPYASSTYNSVLSSYKSIESDINSEDEFLSSESTLISFSTINPYQSSEYTTKFSTSESGEYSVSSESAFLISSLSIPYESSEYNTIVSIIESDETVVSSHSGSMGSTPTIFYESSTYGAKSSIVTPDTAVISSEYSFSSPKYPYSNSTSLSDYTLSTYSTVFSIIESFQSLVISEPTFISYVSSIPNEPTSRNTLLSTTKSVDSVASSGSPSRSLAYGSSTNSAIFSVIESDDSVVASEDYFINAEPSVTSSTFSTSYESSAYISLSSTIGPDDSIVSSESSLASFTSSIANDSSSYNTIFIMESDTIVASSPSHLIISTLTRLYESSTYIGKFSIVSSDEAAFSSEDGFISPKYSYVNSTSSNPYTYSTIFSTIETDGSVISYSNTFASEFSVRSLSSINPYESPTSIVESDESMVSSEEQLVASDFLFSTSSNPCESSSYTTIFSVIESDESVITLEANDVGLKYSYSNSTSSKAYPSYTHSAVFSIISGESIISSVSPFISSTTCFPQESSTYRTTMEFDESAFSSESSFVRLKSPYHNESYTDSSVFSLIESHEPSLTSQDGFNGPESQFIGSTPSISQDSPAYITTFSTNVSDEPVINSDDVFIGSESSLLSSTSFLLHKSSSFSTVFSSIESDEYASSSKFRYINSTSTIPYESSKYSTASSITESDKPVVASEHEFLISPSPHESSRESFTYKSSAHSEVSSFTNSHEVEDSLTSSEFPFISSTPYIPYETSTYSAIFSTMDINESDMSSTLRSTSFSPRESYTYSSIILSNETDETSSEASSQLSLLNSTAFEAHESYTPSVISIVTESIKLEDSSINSETLFMITTVSINEKSSTQNITLSIVGSSDSVASSESPFISFTTSIPYESSTHSSIFSVIESDESVVRTKSSLVSFSSDNHYVSSTYITVLSSNESTETVVSSDYLLVNSSSSITNESYSHSFGFSSIESDESMINSEGSFVSSTSSVNNESSAYISSLSLNVSDVPVFILEPASPSSALAAAYESSTYNTISSTESRDKPMSSPERSLVSSESAFISSSSINSYESSTLSIESSSSESSSSDSEISVSQFVNFTSSTAYESSMYNSISSNDSQYEIVSSSDREFSNSESSFIRSTSSNPEDSYSFKFSTVKSHESTISSESSLFSFSSFTAFESSSYNHIFSVIESDASEITASWSVSSIPSPFYESSTYSIILSNDSKNEPVYSSDSDYSRSEYSFESYATSDRYELSSHSGELCVIESNESSIGSDHACESSQYPSTYSSLFSVNISYESMINSEYTPASYTSTTIYESFMHNTILSSDVHEKSVVTSEFEFISFTTSNPHNTHAYSRKSSIIQSDEFMVSSHGSLISSTASIPYEFSSYSSILSNDESDRFVVSSDAPTLSSTSSITCEYSNGVSLIESRESVYSSEYAYDKSTPSMQLESSSYSSIFPVNVSDESTFSPELRPVGSAPSMVYESSTYISFSSIVVSHESAISSKDVFVGSESPLASSFASSTSVSSAHNNFDSITDSEKSEARTEPMSSLSVNIYDSSTQSTILSNNESDRSVVSSTDGSIKLEFSSISVTMSDTYELSTSGTLCSVIGSEQQSISSDVILIILENPVASLTVSTKDEITSHSSILSSIVTGESDTLNISGSTVVSSTSAIIYESSEYNTTYSSDKSDINSKGSLISSRPSLAHKPSTYTTRSSVLESKGAESTLSKTGESATHSTISLVLESSESSFPSNDYTSSSESRSTSSNSRVSSTYRTIFTSKISDYYVYSSTLQGAAGPAESTFIGTSIVDDMMVYPSVSENMDSYRSEETQIGLDDSVSGLTSVVSYVSISSVVESHTSLNSLATGLVDEPGIIFTHIESLEWHEGEGINGSLPLDPLWNTSVGWEMQPGRLQGFNFSLTLPDVFGFYSSNYGNSKRDSVDLIYLAVDDVNYAQCMTMPGSLYNSYSFLDCYVLQDITSLVRGVVDLQIIFNVGGSTRDSDIYCANDLSSGVQLISFTTNDDRIISKEVKFGQGARSREDPETIVYAVRSMDWDNSNAYYVLGGNCSSSYGFGTISLTLSQGSIDCNSWGAGITSSLNDWYFPKSFADSNSIVLESCNTNEIIISYSNVTAGYRVFLDVIAEQAGFDIIAQYSDKHYCSNIESVDGNGNVSNDYTFVTSKPDGFVENGIDVVHPETISEASLHTKASSNDGSIISLFSTTIVSADSGGDLCTETGVVAVGTNNDGRTYTITSMVISHVARPSITNATIEASSIVAISNSHNGSLTNSALMGSTFTTTKPNVSYTVLESNLVPSINSVSFGEDEDLEPTRSSLSSTSTLYANPASFISSGDTYINSGPRLIIKGLVLWMSLISVSIIFA